ncbi:MAG: cytidine deaminase [Deltaproteobacteria bacterium RBG_13_52_11]|nr:MAG: cytidine deaminase [Deltaproteobacteria bacterium RBG_13_52_11]
MTSLDKADLQLIEVAKTLIALRSKPEFHEVGAALRTRSGKIFSAVNVKANVGRVSVCAEAVAIGMAASAGDTDIERIVAVDQKGRVISPCGMCREMISDYAPEADIIVPGDNGLEVFKVADLLPHKFQKMKT